MRFENMVDILIRNKDLVEKFVPREKIRQLGRILIDLLVEED